MPAEAAKLTTIAIKPTTRDRLRGAGRKGETYDALLNRLLDWYDAGKEAGFEIRTRHGYVRFEEVE